ncbi:hypothetical protein H257_05749 [Aphanomyces astaci]|uniref:Uncharacterized protein n=1 Tax=Aphanomyces astaci TaxID=112090 RepID=W4GNA8_APHAT|nr:hypothetical protein H257_05749 [Aphanomyces astaci]ETV81162.1 hypothetical protein H257_05749 [Aphanomyces astaci]|eukprot:XP_009829020.1 hypothetical protein H257_05749 [Aphanomyces astaci]
MTAAMVAEPGTAQGIVTSALDGAHVLRCGSDDATMTQSDHTGEDGSLPDVGGADYPMDQVVFGLAWSADEYACMEECRASRSELLRQ